MCMLTALYPMRKPQSWEHRIARLFLTDLLMANGASNKDGVGLLTLDGVLTKWEYSADRMAFEPEFNAAVAAAVEGPFIAHVRTTSTGVKATEGAHPFMVGPLGLAHNGTFGNYRKLQAELDKLNGSPVLGDKDPVDSHVFLHLLASKMGDADALTEDHIKAALEEPTGSYALLVTDLRTRDLWVVAGSNPLHIGKVGPYYVVNTSSKNLDAAAGYIAGVAGLVFDKELEITGAVPIPAHTVNKLTARGLVHVCEAPKLKIIQTTTNTYSGTHYSRGLRHSGGSIKKAMTTDEARARARVFGALKKLLYFHDIDLACEILFDTEWHMVDSTSLEVLLAQMTSYYEGSTNDRETLWFGICFGPSECESHAGLDTPYQSLGAVMDFEFPWVLNPTDVLKAAYDKVVAGEVTNE